MKFLDAATLLYNYFQPLVVHVSLESPTSMVVRLSEMDSTTSLEVRDIPCRTSLTPTEVFAIIEQIEERIRREKPELFKRHCVNKMRLP
ncbi:hypothetical protein BVH03_13960 [Pseudomonas sp. PA15(2017)]|uniref:DUF1652 domain-containing protein n=1 Tax=Pseudomonas sp. PA15(2017) TaxID=1932111 RepID=UPI00096925B2|nr:DUF1652 domain-containing protein [Pseudomonas sp. PA15(2017)]OLU27323.1 hypothetical protein BVH03_13960 [Pseudomonas sp. PA15(2017)]